MNNRSSLGVVLCLLMSCSSLFGVQDYDYVLKTISSEPGKIKFDNKLRDFGQVARGERLVNEFKFKNVGEGDLIIHGVHSKNHTGSFSKNHLLDDNRHGTLFHIQAQFLSVKDRPV